MYRTRRVVFHSYNRYAYARVPAMSALLPGSAAA